MRIRNLITIILAVMGLAVSLYLLTVHWGWWQAVCLGVGDCELVNTSRFSEFLGVPVALFGALTYVGIGALSAAILLGYFEEYALPGQFFLAAIGVAFSAYLTYIEVFVLHEICPWCVLSAILITLIAIASGWELRAVTTESRPTD